MISLRSEFLPLTLNFYNKSRIFTMKGLKRKKLYSPQKSFVDNCLMQGASLKRKKMKFLNFKSSKLSSKETKSESSNN